MDPEFLKALELVAEYDRNRPKLVKEFRLYYNEDGSIIGLWETDHPEGNYIVLDDAGIFHRTNTSLLRVVNGELKIIDPKIPLKSRLIKSTQGQRVVAGNAALVLYLEEEYQDVEYYDRKTDN
jgi:hypothetical protein